MKHFAPPSSVLDILCPMHLCVDEQGNIAHLGPTLRKIITGHSALSCPLLDLFDVIKPRDTARIEDLGQERRGRVQLKLRIAPHTVFRGVCVPLQEGWVVNLAFGVSIVDDLAGSDLTSADFAHTDHAIEMLYLAEATSLAMSALDKMNSRLHSSKVAAEEQAFTDTLTGLKNRRAVYRVLERQVAWDRPFALMQVDLDYFKQVNDNFGHAAGDHVLQIAAQAMVDLTRSEDTVARVGGDEFLILFPGVHYRDTLEKIGERLIAQLEVPILFGKNECQISASIGTSFYEPDLGTEVASLMDDVDVALYASKRAGRGRQTFYCPTLRNARERAG